MTMKTFVLHEGLTTRQVNTLVRKAIAQAIYEHQATDFVPKTTRPTFECRKSHGQRYYIFGILIPNLRDTLVATYEPGSSEIKVVFPVNYRGWWNADSYTRCRVRAYDLIVHHSNNFIDPLGKVRDLAERNHL